MCAVAQLRSLEGTLFMIVADLEGGASRLRPLPPLGDGLTPSLTVMLADAKF